VRYVGKPKIVNIVASGQFPQPLDIEKLYLLLDVEEKIYEPETYPALLIKIGANRYHVTLYRNGKYIITGVQSIKQLNDAYRKIFHELRKIGVLKK